MTQLPYVHPHLPPSLPSHTVETSPSLRLDMLQSLRLMHEVIRVRFDHKLPLIRLLHVVLVPLLLRKRDRFVFRPESNLVPLHEVRGRLPAHQGVLPSVAFGENVPVDAPGVRAPGAGLRGGAGGAVDSGGEGLVLGDGIGWGGWMRWEGLVRRVGGRMWKRSLPDCSGLEVNGCARDDGCCEGVTRFAAVEDSFRDRGEARGCGVDFGAPVGLMGS